MKSQLMERSKHNMSYQSIKPVKTLVILGAGVLSSDALDHRGLSRVVEAFLLYKEGMCQNIICCGGKLKGRKFISHAMKDLLLQLGVPLKAIYVESRSRNTFENLSFALNNFPELFSEPIILLSCRWHLRRATRVAKKLGIKAYAYDTRQSRGNSVFIGDRFLLKFISLREFFAYIYFKLRGWL